MILKINKKINKWADKNKFLPNTRTDNSYTKTQGMFVMRLAISRQNGLILKNDVRCDSATFIGGK